MQTSLGVVLGIISMVGFGLSNSISQVPSKAIGSRKTIFYRNLFMVPIIGIVLLLYLNQAHFSALYIIIALAIAAIGYIPVFAFLKALQVGKVGVVSPIANSSIIFTVLFSVIFFGEKLTIIQYSAAAFILAGVFLLSLNFSDLKNSQLFNIHSGIPYALLACFFWGLVFFLFKIPVNILGPILTSFVIESGILISSAIHLRVTKESFRITKKKIYWYLILLGLFGAIGSLAYNVGIVYADVSIIASISAANPILSTLYGRIFYKERLSMQQYLAIAIIIIGVICIMM